MKRKIRIFVIAAVAMLALGFGFIGNSASDAVMASGVAKFELIEGASIRIPTAEEALKNKGSGIRFGSVITEAYYNENIAKESVTSVVLKSKISANVNGTEKTLMQEWILKGDNAITMIYDKNGEMKFFHSIMFDSLIASGSADMKIASALDMTADMWLVVDGQLVRADNADEVDTTRSARIVAYEAYKNGETDETLASYADLNSVTKLNEARNRIFFEESATETAALTKVTGADADAKLSDLTLYDGVQKIGVNKQITASDFTALGEEKGMIAFDNDNKIYEVTAQYVTKAIKDLPDLQSAFKITSGRVVDFNASNKQIEIDNSFNGYYALANDIVANDSDAMHRVLSDGVLTNIFEKFNFFPNRVPYFTGGLTGTFDGNGHTITNLKIGDCGLFGIVNGGTIKNVGLVNVKLYASAHSAKCTLGASMHNAKLENVYISASGIDDDTLKPDGTTAESGDATCKRALLTILMGTVEMNNCVFECGPIEGKEKTYTFGYGSLAAYDNITLNPHAADREARRKWTNVYVISAEALVSHSGNLTNTNVTVIDAYNKKSTNEESVRYLKSMGETDDIAQGIKRYETQSEMTAAKEDLSSFEQSAFWTVNGYTLTWGAE